MHHPRKFYAYVERLNFSLILCSELHHGFGRGVGADFHNGGGSLGGGIHSQKGVHTLKFCMRHFDTDHLLFFQFRISH